MTVSDKVGMQICKKLLRSSAIKNEKLIDFRTSEANLFYEGMLALNMILGKGNKLFHEIHFLKLR